MNSLSRRQHNACEFNVEAWRIDSTKILRNYYSLEKVEENIPIFFYVNSVPVEGLALLYTGASICMVNTKLPTHTESTVEGLTIFLNNIVLTPLILKDNIWSYAIKPRTLKYHCL